MDIIKKEKQVQFSDSDVRQKAISAKRVKKTKHSLNFYPIIQFLTSTLQ